MSLVMDKNSLDDAKDENADATKYLANLKEQCATKMKERDTRKKMRTDEIAAISEAVKILSDDDALDVFKKAVPSASLLAEKKPKVDYDAFMQMGASGTARLQRFAKAKSLIAKMEKKHPSAQMKLLLMTVSSNLKALEEPKSATEANYDGAAKVIDGMIDNMVHVLHDEDVEDEHKKDWCSNETEVTMNLQTEKQNLVEKLKAELETMSDELDQTNADIKVLEETIAALDKSVHDATEQRKKEHAEYLETAQLTEAAIELMGKAKNRLQKFYNPSLYVAPEATPAPAAFVQIRAVRHASSRVAPPEAPEADLSFNKNKKSGGVMELMDMLTNELKASLAEAQHDEKTAQSQYTEIMSESQETRQNDAKSVTDKSAAKATLQERLTSTKETKHMTLQELDNVGQYIQELHGSCDFILDNFKLRQEARTNEIEGLKNAKAVLNGANYA